MTASDLKSLATIGATWRKVSSSNVRRVGWLPNSIGLVEFNDGSVYAYFGVSRQRMVTAAHALVLTNDMSVGIYLNKKVLHDFKHLRLA